MPVAFVTIPRTALRLLAAGAFCAGFSLAGSMMLGDLAPWVFWLNISGFAIWAVLTVALFRMVE